MRRNMHISRIGLKLIKAYEGYRPVDRHLVNGQHVVGYGHIIEGDDRLVLTRPEAEDLLLRDLQPYEDMINETVHAPLSQSQYDALVSLAFNIGPRAFTESDTLRALNNGRPLDAASGFDIWRKSTIDGKTYVVDALMRRRAAEKALFLRTEGQKTLPASRADLPPVKDEMVALLSTEDALPIASNDPRNGIVARVPYEADEMPTQTPETYTALATPEVQITQNDEPVDYTRRREDGPAGILELSEVYDDSTDDAPINDDLVDDTYEVDDFDYDEPEFDEIAFDATKDTDAEEGLPSKTSSRIADTASELSDRLDALIDNVAADDSPNTGSNWPESLIQASDASETPTAGEELPEVDADVNPDMMVANKPADIIIDNLVEDDAFRERTDSAAKYINIEPPIESETTKVGIGYYIPLFIGMSLLGASAGAIFGDPTAILGEWGPLLSFVGLLIGAIMTIFTVYYAVKARRLN